MIGKKSSLLLAGLAACVVASEARPVSACDVDGIHAAASAQARQAFSVAGTGSGVSSSVVTALTTPLASGNPVLENALSRPSGAEARKVASPGGVTAGDSRMSVALGAWSLQSDYVPLIEPMSSSPWSLQSGYVPLFDMMSSAWSLQSNYVPLIDTMSSSEILLQPASFTPNSD